MINLKPNFKINNLKKLSTIGCAHVILENVVGDELSPIDLVNFIFTHTGMSKASINGTLWGNDMTPPPWKLMGTEEFKNGWFMAKTSTGQRRMIRLNSKTSYTPIVPSYNTSGKQKARSMGAEFYLKKFRKKNPKILTMASEFGYDVKGFLNIKPESIIYNVENNLNVLNTIMKQKLPIVTYYGSLFKMIENMPNEYFDIINYDSDGYVSDSMDKTLKLINQKRSAKYVCLTIQDHKSFRNHGTFADRCRKQYNSVMEYLEQEPMTNYIIDKTFTYNRKPQGEKSARMRVVIYKLKC